MRRGISIAMVIFGLAALITGIEKLFPPFNEMTYPPHLINALIFGLLVIIHTWLNWKPVVRYFKGLRWWWALIGLGVVLVIWAGIMVPVLTLTGNF